MASKFAVKFAVYGAVKGGDTKSMNANDVTPCLQKELDAHAGVVTISNGTLGGDAYYGVLKQFGALVLVDGKPVFFAGQEGQTIDFNYYKNGQNHCH